MKNDLFQNTHATMHQILTSVSLVLSFLIFSFFTPVADLAGSIGVTKTDGRTVAAPGDTLTYSIVITNAKAKDVHVDVEDLIPSSTTFLSASDGGIKRGKLDDVRVTWGNLLIPMGGSRTITVTVRVKEETADGTVVRNTVNVKTPELITAMDTTTVKTVNLLISVKSLGTQGTAVENEPNVNFFRFEASGDGFEDVG